MRILEKDGVAVYIYDNEHPPPHCHLVFSNGEEKIVGLPLLDVWFGKSIKKWIRNYLEENIETLLNTWDEKHPIRN